MRWIKTNTSKRIILGLDANDTNINKQLNPTVFCTMESIIDALAHATRVEVPNWELEQCVNQAWYTGEP